MAKLPKEDEIIMRNSYFFENALAQNIKEHAPFSLTYIQEDTKNDYIQPAPPYANKKLFEDIEIQDGTINKDGIKKWLEYLVNFFHIK